MHRGSRRRPGGAVRFHFAYRRGDGNTVLGSLLRTTAPDPVPGLPSVVLAIVVAVPNTSSCSRRSRRSRPSRVAGRTVPSIPTDLRDSAPHEPAVTSPDTSSLRFVGMAARSNAAAAPNHRIRRRRFPIEFAARYGAFHARMALSRHTCRISMPLAACMPSRALQCPGGPIRRQTHHGKA